MKILFLVLLSIGYAVPLLAQDTTVTKTETPIIEDTLAKVFNKVDAEASFPGGEEGWKNYLKKRLNWSVPGFNEAPPGVYQIIVKFSVEKDGRVSNIKALTKYGYGMEWEVIRVIRQSPNWIPALQDGKPVKAYRLQPIVFEVSQ